jgi:hypothetical protein
MSKEANSAAKRPRRRWQFTLRGLLLLVLVIAVGLFVYREFDPYLRQEHTAALIARLGGSYQTREGGNWWLRLFGRTHNIIEVDISKCDHPDAYVAAIAELPAIEMLVVGGPTFKDEHAQQLQRLRTLRCLVLDTTSVSNEAVVRLRESLRNTDVVTTQRSAGAALANKGVLVANMFAAIRFTDADAVYLKTLKELTLLRLEDTEITDAALENITALNKLEVLWLSRTGVTDAGLDYLKGLTELRWIKLDSTRVTAAGVAKLKQALPQCRIEWP